MARELFCQAVLKFVLGLVLVNILIFFPAGTFYYWHAWLFIGILFIPMFFAGIVMMFKNPELLKKRLNAKEQQTEQDLVVKLSGLMFVLGFVIAGLNFRFKWITLPEWVSWLATVIFLFSYLLYAEGLRENTYLSRTVEIQQDQKELEMKRYCLKRN